jgi:uncharacterized membrane protein
MEKDKAPKVNHKLFNAILAVQVIVIWIYAIYLFTSLPENIPTHFSGSGEANDFGNKSQILIIPFVFTFLVGFMSFIRQADVQYNIPFQLTEENKAYHYQQARKFVGMISIYLNILATYILYSIQTASQGKEQPANIFIALAPLGIIILLYFFIARKKS